MRSLLAERFGLTIHFEDREAPVLGLVLKNAKPGPKLVPHPAEAPCPEPAYRLWQRWRMGGGARNVSEYGIHRERPEHDVSVGSPHRRANRFDRKLRILSEKGNAVVLRLQARRRPILNCSPRLRALLFRRLCRNSWA
jgi:uncharacterized protein (TIGR03435 family)